MFARSFLSLLILSVLLLAEASHPLPDPLRMESGAPVTSARMWRDQRRPELLTLFASQEYGRTPTARLDLQYRTDSVVSNALNGLATRKQITFYFPGAPPGPALHLLLYLPAQAHGKVPVFVGLNFSGNHTVAADPGITLPEVWLKTPTTAANPKEQLPPHRERAVESSRGSAASQWQVEQILSRGYGLATMYCGDLEPDFPAGAAFGVRPLFPGYRAERAPQDWGAIGAWAWGLSRILDYLVKEEETAVNARQIAVMGFSRLGKAALWAGAQDERFAIVISNESGQGGVGISHRKGGERLEHLNNAFPHWFCLNYRRYIGREEELPVDGHELLALIAPRPAYVASAELDSYSDPKSEFEAVVEAGKVYELLGKQGVGTAEMPQLGRPAMADLAYHIRPGKHDVTAFDWGCFLQFADRHFGRAATGTVKHP